MPANLGQVRSRSAADLEPHEDEPCKGEDSAPSPKKCRTQFSCEVCGTHYTAKRALARHRHTAQHRQAVGLPLLEEYPCTVCSRNFNRDHDRVRHENEVHRGQKRSTRLNSTVPRDRTGFNPPRSPRSGPTASSLTVECIEERSFLLEDDGSPMANGWDILGTIMEVYPGPANRATAHPEDAPKGLRDGVGQPALVLHDKTCAATVAGSLSPPSGHHPNATYAVDRTSRSWLAEDSDNENDTDPMLYTELSLQSTISTVSDSAVDMSEAIHDPHEPKRPSITTFDYREKQERKQQEDKVSIPSEQDISNRLDCFSEMSLTPRPHATVIQRRGKIRTIPAKDPLVCIFCDQAFSEDIHDLLPHLRDHLDTLQGQHELTCVYCKISFVHKEDFTRHHINATIVGDCGFRFIHKTPCTGHHRPPARNDTMFSDSDHFRLCVQLRHWEQAQLQAYITEIERLAAKQSARVSTCYSLEALFRRSKSSLSSLAVSVNTHASAPCDAVNGQTDVRGLQGRLKMMSLKGSALQVRHTAKKVPQMLRQSRPDSKDQRWLTAST